ncbi:STAS domain-containing protein [Leptodesmis sp.]|uniref:STAS domain-containing protein n=1 Tax=Leptodesmis sp. TaxID=3100501 RepID=UPI0040535552
MTHSPEFRLLKPEGILSASVAKQLLEQVEECRKENISIILIDLENVAMIDSFGLGTLISIHTKLRIAGGKLYLCSLQKQANFLFDISAMNRVLDVLPDQEAFYEQLQQTYSAC